jgi:hypothetical protein
MRSYIARYKLQAGVGGSFRFLPCYASGSHNGKVDCCVTHSGCPPYLWLEPQLMCNLSCFVWIVCGRNAPNLYVTLTSCQTAMRSIIFLSTCRTTFNLRRPYADIWILSLIALWPLHWTINLHRIPPKRLKLVPKTLV